MIPITLVKPPVKQQAVSVPTEESLARLLEMGPDQQELVQQLIDTHKLQLRIENGKLLTSLQGTELWLKKFITEDPDMIELKREIRLAAKFDDEVLITGETGTGKELLARALIGDRETRLENPGIFVAVNCAGLPEELVESELFGHVQGAFTGAVKDKQGMMAYAKGGVFFLDEIGDLPLAAQGKLLRVLQERVVRRVGSNRDEPITCKVVCGTKKDIVKMTELGTFRDDLFARISTLHFHVKPLRDRPNDIEPIIKSMKQGEKFLQWAFGKGSLDTKLNVRSLQQHVRRWIVLGRI